MTDCVNYVELVKQAQLGCRESMTHLTQEVKDSLCAYIYRLTLDSDLTEELVQATMLELVKSIKKLKFEHDNQFWAWLYRTALGKVQLNFRARQHQRKVKMSILDKERLSSYSSSDYNDGLSNIIRKELSEVIFEAIGNLKLRYRNVLILRCFEQRSYREIAAIMGCSETMAQVLFFRAKRSLKGELSKHGFGKGFLLIALGLFARLTSHAKAVLVAQVTSGSLKVGFTGTLIGAAQTKLGIIISAAIVATVFTISGITAIKKNNTYTSQQQSTSISDKSVDYSEVFEYPSELLDSHDPDGKGWKGIKKNDIVAVPIVLQNWLVDPPPLEESSVVLLPGQWVELKFSGEIVDGFGYDIFVVEWGENGEKARLFITDGNNNELLLGTIMIGDSGLQVPTEVGFDISGISLPFKPYAVRIIGIKGGGDTAGFDLHSVRARIK